MAVTFDAVSSSGVDNSTTLSWTHTPVGTPTAVLVGLVYFNESNSVTAATYAGSAMTLESTAITGANGTRASLYSLPNPTSGAQTVSFTFGAASYASAGAVTVTGSDTTDAIRGIATSASGNTTTPTVDVTSQTDDLVIDVLHHADVTVAWTVGAGQTERWYSSAFIIDGKGSTEAGATTVTMSWTANGVNVWAIAAGSIKAAAAAGSVNLLAGKLGMKLVGKL